MRKLYRPDAGTYRGHFHNQRGGHSLPGFRGGGIQRGYRLGSMFRSFFRSAVPLLKSGARTVGKAALNTGIDVAKDVLDGNDVRTAAAGRLKETGQKLKGQAIDAAKKKVLPMQNGQGRKRKATGSAKSTPNKRKKQTQD